MLKFGDKVRIKGEAKEGILTYVTAKAATINFEDGAIWGGIPLHEIEAVDGITQPAPTSDPNAETKVNLPAVDAVPIKPFHAPLVQTLNGDVELLAAFALVGMESMALQGDVISAEALLRFKKLYEETGQ